MAINLWWACLMSPLCFLCSQFFLPSDYNITSRSCSVERQCIASRVSVGACFTELWKCSKKIFYLPILKILTVVHIASILNWIKLKNNGGFLQFLLFQHTQRIKHSAATRWHSVTLYFWLDYRIGISDHAVKSLLMCSFFQSWWTDHCSAYPLNWSQWQWLDVDTCRVQATSDHNPPVTNVKVWTAQRQWL